MKLMSVRDFVRGGYARVQEPILVMRNLQPLGTWTPYGLRESPKQNFEELVAVKKTW